MCAAIQRESRAQRLVRMILEHCVCAASLFTPGCTLASRSIYKPFSDSPSPLLAACSSSAVFSHSDNHSAVLTGLSLIITQPTVRLCITLHHSTKNWFLFGTCFIVFGFRQQLMDCQQPSNDVFMLMSEYNYDSLTRKAWTQYRIISRVIFCWLFELVLGIWRPCSWRHTNSRRFWTLPNQLISTLVETPRPETDESDKQD